MKTAAISALKSELTELPANELMELCLRLARFKKENKELLTYLLFEAHDEEAFIDGVMADIEQQFQEINRSSLYFVKKSLRKILRLLGKFIRYSGNSETEVRLLLFFCGTLKNSGIPVEKNPVIANLFRNQLKKIKKVIGALHEDLQYEYLREWEQLN